MSPLCPNRRGPAPPGAHRGFALLITLALLALVMALLLGLATLVRVESAIAGQTQQEEQARRNALLALQLAAGRLQAFAGPDRRVTARADLLAASAGNPYWTGVWGPGPGVLTWLVSGNEGQPLAVTPEAAPVADPAPDNDAVWLLRTATGTPAERIKVRRQDLRAALLPGWDGPRVVGHYAWWVGDEGVKAKFNLVNAAAGAAPGTLEQAAEFMSAQQSGVEQLAPAFAAYAGAKGDTAAGAALRDRISRVTVLNQVPYVHEDFSLAALRDGFHDLTASSLGVIADAHNGGLKKDLTRGLVPGAPEPAGELFAGGPAWDLVRSYCQLRADPVDDGWQITPRAHQPPEHGVHPLVLLFQVVWGADRSNGRFRLLLQPMAVLGNPYDVSLAAADYRLVWRQGGGLELRNPPAGSEVAFASGTPAALLGEDPQFVIRQAAFRPGEARVFALPAGSEVPYEIGAGVQLAPGYSPDARAYRELGVEADPSAPEMQVRAAAGPAGFDLLLGDGGRLQEVTGGAGAASEATGVAPVLGAPVRAGLRMGQDDENAPGDLSGLRWLADFNLRAPAIGPLPAWGRNPLYGPATPRGGSADTILDGTSVFWGPSNRVDEGGRQFVPLFHVPRTDLHSPAQLQHANLSATAAGPGSAAGQSYADPHTPDGTPDLAYRINEVLWDRYFFSTLPSDTDGPLNRRLIPYRRDGRPPDAAALHGYTTAAAHLLVNGPFNVNSTSVAAWRALLASLSGQRLACADPATDALTVVTVGHAFPRAAFVFGGDDDGWRGFRALTDAELQELAVAIVDAVRARGPFRSLAEFVNRPLHAPAENDRRCGLLQAALDRIANPPASLEPVAGLPAAAGPSPGLAWPAASQGHRATLAPGWLSQADVLGVVGPVLAVRSDTFLVRAYGDAVNPATGATTGRAWCEAVLQRLPEYVDPSDPPEAADNLSATNQAYGRRFAVIRFRWLAPEEV